MIRAWLAGAACCALRNNAAQMTTRAAQTLPRSRTADRFALRRSLMRGAPVQQEHLEEEGKSHERCAYQRIVLAMFAIEM